MVATAWAVGLLIVALLGAFLIRRFSKRRQSIVHLPNQLMADMVSRTLKAARRPLRTPSLGLGVLPVPVGLGMPHASGPSDMHIVIDLRGEAVDVELKEPARAPAATPDALRAAPQRPPLPPLQRVVSDEALPADPWGASL